MNTETHTNKQAMDRLGVTSRSAFYHLKRTYPHSFVVVKQGTDGGTVTVYDEQALDKFMEILECVKTQTHKTS